MQPKNQPRSAPTRPSSSAKLWPLLLLGLTLTGCAAHSPAPYSQPATPAVLSEPESPALASYSQRVRDFLKRAADTLNSLELTGKP